MGKLATIKTKETGSSVDAFINAIPDGVKREDTRAILQFMQQATGEQPRMWGPSIVGFGNVRIKSAATGREVEWFIMGFSPRKAALTLYLGLDVSIHAAALKKLGKHKTGKGCLYINRLEDVDRKLLQEIIRATAKK